MSFEIREVLDVVALNGGLGGLTLSEKQGCMLGAIHRVAYPQFPDEAQLLWYKDLTSLNP
jgi:hypothetical protein